MMEIIDTHLHLIYPERFTYKWTENIPALQGDFLYEDYASIAKAIGITSTLHMEVDVAPSQMEEESLFIKELMLEDGSLICGSIASCRPESLDFKEYLERQITKTYIKGFRRILHTSPDELSQSELFRKNLSLLAGYGYPFDLCVLSKQLYLATSLAKACPTVSFVLDHCGIPDFSDSSMSAWKENIKAVSKLPNVACKISGIIAYGNAENWKHGDILAIVRDLKPYFDEVVELFGWNRIVWGSDWPVCTLTSSLTTWLQVTHELLAGASKCEKSALFSENAKRIYRL